MVEYIISQEMCIKKLQIKIAIKMRSFLIYLINNASFCLCTYFVIVYFDLFHQYFKYKNIVFLPLKMV